MVNYKLVYSAVGFLLGALTGGLIVGKRCQKKMEGLIEELEEFYGEDDPYKKGNQKDEKEEDSEGTEQQDEYSYGERPNESVNAREKLLRNEQEKERIVQYDKMYTPKDAESDNDGDETESLEEYPELEPDPEYDDWHRRRGNDEPKIISIDDIGELPGFIEEQELYFYQEDGVLAEEDGTVVENQIYTLGDALDKFNFRNNDEDVIYVLNYRMDTVYDVIKVRAAYTDSYGEPEEY